MNHDMLLVVTDRMGKAIVTAMALHGSLVSCIAELQKLNYETLPCESNFDCSTISSHSSRMVFCGYKLNTLNLDFGHSAANSVINAGMFRGPGSWRHHSTCRPDGLLRHSVTRTPTAYPALPSQPVVLRGRPASLGFQAVVVVLDFYSCSRHCSWGFAEEESDTSSTRCWPTSCHVDHGTALKAAPAQHRCSARRPYECPTISLSSPHSAHTN